MEIFMANSDRRSRQIPNQDRLIALGQAVAERNGGPLPRRKRAKATGKKRVFKIIGLSTLGVVVALVLLVVADYYYIGSKIHHTNVSSLQSDSGPENILFARSSRQHCVVALKNRSAIDDSNVLRPTGLRARNLLVLPVR
jgi:hypothetical protein